MNVTKTTITFDSQWNPPNDLFKKLAELGHDFSYKSESENGYEEEGFYKGKNRFVTRMMDEYGALDNAASEDDIPLFERLPALTKKHAALNSPVKKIFTQTRDGEKFLDYDKSGEFGIISEFAENRIKVSRAQIDEDGNFVPSAELIAEYNGMEEFIAAGWTIDVYYSGLGEEDLWPKDGESGAKPTTPTDLNPPASFGGDIPF